MAKKLKVKTPKPELMMLGWIEHIDFPDLKLHHVRSKIDTGARTSAFHATETKTFYHNDDLWVRFRCQLDEKAPSLSFEQPVYDIRQIKNTGGVAEERVVIRTNMRIAGRTWPISVSLTDRSNMRFPTIIGRSALKSQNISIHTRKADLAPTYH